jgi:NADH:ubiquinone oxidoreductase subunit 4 (subunit M)
VIESVAPALLVAAIMVVGIYPAVLTDVFGPGMEQIVSERFAGLR